MHFNIIKHGLLYLLEHGTIYTLNDNDSVEDSKKLRISTESLSIFEFQREFLKGNKYVLSDAKTSSCMYLNTQSTNLASALFKYRYVEINRDDLHTLREGHLEWYLEESRTYTLSALGLETALKIQEHEDNERRFEQQTEISNVLKRNSTVSLVVSSIAVVMLAIGLWFSYERLKHSEERLEIMENSIIKPEEPKLPIEEEKTEL